MALSYREAFMLKDICASLRLGTEEIAALAFNAGPSLPAAGTFGYLRGTGARALIALEGRDGRLLIIMEDDCGSIARIIDAADLYPTEREARFCGRAPQPSRSARQPFWQPAAEVAA